MFRKILIANRGEIALRIIRACKELGIDTVAVHSEADADSLHVKFADESVCIGPSPSAESYLKIPSILAAAEITGADAVHPGYGFLAENDQFAAVVQSSGLTWIGPQPEVIRQMGDKAAARRLMHAAHVPIVPGTPGVVADEETALAFAAQAGYPVIVKAVAGGGGRGMRVAHDGGELRAALPTARAEAEKAFGNPDVYIEKYLSQPRHVEIQLLGDKHGNVVHLGERDCSLQRRHQKLIEESPSPAVDEKLRRKLGEAAVRGARRVGYDSAGTMEFLLDADGSFFFMEMNTRIQVEHPVTELVTGIDIVKEQIASAAGEPLRLKQGDVHFTGHAIEVRINAEDPRRDFRPSPGTIEFLHMPGGIGVRVDSHIYQGYTIGPWYDSLLAKLVVHGRDRVEAIARLQRALAECLILGVSTTTEFSLELVSSDIFQKGQATTRSVETFLAAGAAGPV
ncbi:MAG TPA: acetyl-CoA carboxylase biotin carboxylase subunit [Candidatus Krumholzibacteria bacterium]|nr:acetyl-CoA carboxylase biotin carboxylase subunit [Candidatus Krumholzibacteria bacterium]